MQQELSEVYFYLKGTLKYKRVVVFVALFVCACAWAFVFFMPDKFESQAKVHIDSSTVIRPLMRGMVIEPDVSALIRIIQQLMFTRPNLEKITELSGLTPPKIGGAVSEEFLDELKKNINIKSAGNRDIFDISYSSPDPQAAKNVVQAVLTVFSEQTQGKALEDASDAQKFIEQQIRDYEIRLQSAEKSKEDFRRNNLDLLTDTDQLQSLQKLKGDLQLATTVLEQSIARKNVLAEQIKQVQDSDDDWGVTNLSKPLLPEEARIQALKDKKTELLLKYTDKHPEIMGIDKLIETLQEQKKQKEEKSSSENSGENDLIDAQKMTNPYVQTLKSTYDNVDAEVAANQTLVNSISERIKKAEEGLKGRLAIETEMKNLNRDYETISQQYNQLLARREQAHITERVDDQTSRLKFKIADPPTKPLKPAYPNRVLLYSLTLLVGIIFGFGGAFLIYFIRPVFMSVRQVRVVTGLPSLGGVSITTQGIAQTESRDWMLLSTGAVMLICYAGLMVYELLK